MAEFLFALFFPAYQESVLYTKILAISFPLTMVARLRATAIQSRFDKNKTYLYTWTSAVVQILAIFIGGNLYGLTGIAIGLVIVSLFQIVITKIIIKSL